MDTISTPEHSFDEILLETATEDVEDSQLLDALEQLSERPLNLNEATLDEIASLPFLPSTLAYALFDKRKQIGEYSEWNQLALLDGMTSEIFTELQRYTMFTSPAHSPSFFSRGKYEVRSRIQEDDQPGLGFLDGSYQGSRLKSYQRLRTSFRDTQTMGVLFEKDAGEPSFADHVAGFVSFEKLSFVDRLIVGDYTVSGGQGVVFWNSFGFSKGSEVIASTKKHDVGIAPYLSSTESSYFRGVSTQIRAGDFSLLAFYSGNTFDASFDSLSGSITSFYESGLHRTETELGKVGIGKESLLGGRIAMHTNTAGTRYDFGISGYASRFDHTVSSIAPFTFDGKNANMLGADYDIYFGTVNLFGEWARSHTGSIGGISGITSQLTKSVIATVLYRRFPETFISLHGFAFGERNGDTQNEEGIYFGLRYTISKSLAVQMYFDQFRFPNKTYTLPLPSSGSDVLGFIEWKPIERSLFTVRVKRERKDDAVAALDANGRDIRPVTQRLQENLRAEFQYQGSKHFRFRMRVENVSISYQEFLSAQNGYLLFFDVKYSPSRSFAFTARVAAYNTDSYDSRMYMFENDVPGVVSNGALYGEGMRLTLIVQHRPFESVLLSCKYGQTVKSGVTSIGSGKDEVQGSSLGRITLQLDFVF